MNLTTDQRRILAHVVVDADVWWAHAQALALANYNEVVAKLEALNGTEKPEVKIALEKDVLFTPEMRATAFLQQKLARWTPDYETERVRPQYKTRAERHAIEVQRDRGAPQ